MLKIIPVPAYTDNYIWLIIHTPSQQCLIVDPGEAAPVITALAHYNLNPVGILLTHHHFDHVDGVPELLKHYPNLTVWGAAKENIPTVTHPLKDKDLISIKALDLKLEILAIPGHTHGHIAYYGAGLLFCGDTLFTAGCGRVFEGTPEQMYHSLCRLADLPDSTLVYCGHEYTQANLQFAQTLEPNNPAIAERIAVTHQLRSEGLPTVPSTMAQEKLTNPFLRCRKISIIHAAQIHAGNGLQTPSDVFYTIREWKNSFKIN